MIISLFMDETPLVCGSGDHPVAGAAGRQAGLRDRQPAAGRGHEDAEQDQNVHVSAALKNREASHRPGACLNS
jgi:hypothetical protein